MAINKSFWWFFYLTDSRQGFEAKYQNPWSLIIVAKQLIYLNVYTKPVFKIKRFSQWGGVDKNGNAIMT